jgi:hypothetical protein
MIVCCEVLLDCHDHRWPTVYAGARNGRDARVKPAIILPQFTMHDIQLDLKARFDDLRIAR